MLRTIARENGALNAGVIVVSVLSSCFTLFTDFISSMFGTYSDKRFFLVVLMVTFVIGGLFVHVGRRRVGYMLIATWPFTFLISSFLLSAIQFSNSPYYLIEPIFYTFYFLAFAIVGFRFSLIKNLSGSIVAFSSVAAVSCFFYAAMTITVYLFAVTDDFSRLDSVIPWGFVNIRYWSHIATWILPILPLAVLAGPFKDNRLWRLGVSFTGAIWWWMVFMSVSRGTMAGIAVGFVFVCATFGRSSLPWAKQCLWYVVYGAIAWLVLSVIIPGFVFDDFQVRSLHVDTSGRLPLWREAWAMSLQNFPFGMGPQSWLTHDLLTDSYRASPKFGHPHNMYLMWAAEYGWISIGGLLVLGVVALRRLWTRRVELMVNPTPELALLIGFTASVTAALVHAGVSAVFIAPGSMLIGLLVLSVFWALIHPPVSAGQISHVVQPGSVRRLAGYLFMAVVVIGSGLWFRDVLRYHQAMVDDLPWYDANVHEGALPRFWFHGFFPRPASQMPPVADDP